MRRSTESAFTMIEVAVAIAVVAILAGMATPLVLKALNQQREQKTRENLKIAWEAMFGARDRRVANMRADFGFNPGTLPDLRFMTNRTGVFAAAATPPVYLYNQPLGFSWGWNGPYWTGPVRPAAGFPGGVPVDGWGNPIRLALVGGNWQVQSAGADGLFPAPHDVDNIMYPPTPQGATALSCNITLNVTNRSGAPVTGIVLRVQSRAQTNALPAPAVYTIKVFPPTPHSTPAGTPDLPTLGLPVLGNYSITLPNQMPGPINIQVNRSAPTLGNITTYVSDLLPGETRTVDLVID